MGMAVGSVQAQLHSFGGASRSGSASFGGLGGRGGFGGQRFNGFGPGFGQGVNGRLNSRRATPFSRDGFAFRRNPQYSPGQGNLFDQRNRGRFGQNNGNGYVYPTEPYYPGYGYTGVDYIPVPHLRDPGAYAGRLGYAGPNGYAAVDGYAGPYGYPFDNPVWWDWRFHHPYRPR